MDYYDEAVQCPFLNANLVITDFFQCFHTISINCSRFAPILVREWNSLVCQCHALFFSSFDTSISRSMVSFYTNNYRLEEFLKLNQAERSLSITFSILRKNSSRWIVIGKFKLKKFISQRIYLHRRCIIDKKKSDRSFESLIRQSFARRPIGRGEIDANN